MDSKFSTIAIMKMECEPQFSGANSAEISQGLISVLQPSESSLSRATQHDHMEEGRHNRSATRASDSPSSVEAQSRERRHRHRHHSPKEGSRSKDKRRDDGDNDDVIVGGKHRRSDNSHRDHHRERSSSSYKGHQGKHVPFVKSHAAKTTGDDFKRRQRNRSRSPVERKRRGGAGGGGGGGGDDRHRIASRSRDREEQVRRRQRSDDHTRRLGEKRSHKSGSRSRSSERDRRSREAARCKNQQQSHSPDGAGNSRTQTEQLSNNDLNVTTASTSKFAEQGEQPKSGSKNPLDKSVDKPNNIPLMVNPNPLMQQMGPRLVTAQMAVAQSMAAMTVRAQQLTGVTLPKYYNPAAVNPLKYAEQMQKRKLLWHNKEKTVVSAPSNNKWEQTTFLQDQDGKMAAKFKKLMGIKEEAAANQSSADDDHLKKQEELFRTLDQQYEVARISTHTQRGVGLGFSSSVAAAATVASIYNNLHQQ